MHPTAEWIFAKLKPDYPNLNLATVYRNLCQLKEAGQIRSVGVLAGQEHFDADLRPHSHVLCSRCGKICDLAPTATFAQVQERAGALTGFEVRTLQFVGLCPECQRIPGEH